MFSLVAIQTLVECKLKWFLFPGKFFLSTQALRYSPTALSCSTAVHFQTWCMALPQTQTRPGQDFYNFPPAICVEKVKSAPLENLGEIRVAGEEWRYPQQFCLNTNWTLLSGAIHSSQTPRQPRWGWGSSQSSWWLWSAMHWANEANNDQGYLEELQLSCCLGSDTSDIICSCKKLIQRLQFTFKLTLSVIVSFWHFNCVHVRSVAA